VTAPGLALLVTATAAAADAPRATLVAGVIVRDAETRDAIDATKDAKPQKGDPLELEVTKSRYRMDVTSGGKRVKVYPVAMGGRPEHPKTRDSDGRTPEGRYVLIPHHPSPGFGPCFYICYPNGTDARRGLAEKRIGNPVLERIDAALRRGQRPPHDTPLGGLILLHGTKLRSLPALTETNWTTGCIAMENADVEELLRAFSPNDRPLLTIRP
jgi:murein L,D-transpeptidase YafK